MAVLDFPSAPTVGQIAALSNGFSYQWDGAVWLVSTAPVANAGGDLTGTYPNPQVTPAAKSKWAVAGTTLTPVDATKAIKIVGSTGAGDQTQLVLGNRTAKGRLQAFPGFEWVGWSYNGWYDGTAWHADDAAQPTWRNYVYNDNYIIDRDGPGGSPYAALLKLDPNQLTVTSLRAFGADVMTLGTAFTTTKAHFAIYQPGSTCWLTNASLAGVTDDATKASWQINLGGGDACSIYRAPPAASAAFAQLSWWDTTGNYTIVGAAATKASGTTWANPSDIRLKSDVAPYARGLIDILSLEPITYRLKADPDQECYGFDAAAVREVMPECVFETRMKLDPADEEETEGVLTFDMHPILITMVIAIKELTARLEALESK